MSAESETPMTALDSLLKEIREKAEAARPLLKDHGSDEYVCRECGFSLNYRHRHGCSVPEETFARLWSEKLATALVEIIERQAEALAERAADQCLHEDCVAVLEANPQVARYWCGVCSNWVYRDEPLNPAAKAIAEVESLAARIREGTG